MEGPLNSPIPWPTSDKKRKTSNLYTPENRGASGNKLSSKKNSGKKTELNTPKKPVSKWLKPSMSSIETFHRVYNEMTNSSSNELSSIKHGDDRKHSHCLEERKDSFSPMTGGDNTRHSTLNGRVKKNVIVVDSDSDSLPSLSSSRSRVSRDPRLSNSKDPCSKFNQRSLFSDTSSDDDEFFKLPPPLHERIPLTHTGSHNTLQTDGSRGKSKPVNLFGQKKGKENLSYHGNRSDKAITFNDSSEDELPDIPALCLGKQKTSKQPLSYDDIPRPKLCAGVIKSTPTEIFSSSSEDELPIIKSDKRSIPKASTSSDNRPNGLTKATPCGDLTPKSLKPNLLFTLPKSFKPKPVLSTPKTPVNKLSEAIILSSSSEEDDLRSLTRTVPRKTKPGRIIFDTSSESELPDTEITPSTGKKLTKPATHSNHKTTTLPSSQIHTSHQPGIPKLWIGPESLTESSKFLKSLSEAAPVEHRVANFRQHFSKHKDDLVKKLYQLYNESIFEKKLPADMSITWNIRLTKTAGYCYMRCHRDQSRSARIELSTKVLTSAERVRDTLLHEMCHAAAFIVHGYREGHGPIFKYWGKKAGVLFPFLPVVSRCHTYSIDTKYVYRCTGCKAMIGRHSKSLDTTRKGCGHCGGRFELLVNGVQASAKKKTPEFAKFVKENYKHIKKTNQSMKHADIMQKLGEMFAEKAKV